MKQKIYMICAVPGSGKTWITNQIKDLFTFVHHDGFIGHINQPDAYVEEILKKADGARKPLLIEAPFSMSAIEDPLKEAGYQVEGVVIHEDPNILARRYQTDPNRTGAPIPKGHITRMETFVKRAIARKWFHGTSKEVLEHLKAKGS